MQFWFGRKAAPADVRPLVPVWLSDAAGEGLASGYAGQVDEVFRNNPVGQRAVRLVAGMLGGLTVYAAEGDARAAAIASADGLLEGLAANLLLHGNGYVQLLGGDDAPIELVALRPERVSVVADERGWPVAYLYRAGGQAVRIERCDALQRVRVAHVKALHPRDDHYGLLVKSSGRFATFAGGAWTVEMPAAAIANPSGGTTVDAEARTAIAAMLAALRSAGVLAS
jgi:hypothetical protein